MSKNTACKLPYTVVYIFLFIIYAEYLKQPDGNVNILCVRTK